MSTIKNSRRVRFGYKIRKKIFIFAIQKSLRAFLNCVFTGRAVRIKGICCRCYLAGAIRAARLENAGFRTDLFRENAFFVKMRLSRSAERDKREMKIKFPLTMARAKRRPFWMVWLIKEMPQMDRSFQIRHFGEKAVGGFDFLGVFM